MGFFNLKPGLLFFLSVFLVSLTGIVVSEVFAEEHEEEEECHAPAPHASCPTPCSDYDEDCNSCGECDSCIGSDFYICGECDNIGGDGECDGTDVRGVSCPGSTGSSCIHCKYGTMDSSPLHCGSCNEVYLPSGETSVFGEYTPGGPGCCGDDAGENPRRLESDCTADDCGAYSNNWPFTPATLVTPSDSACCNSGGDAVYNRVCYEPGAYQLPGTSHSGVPGRPNAITTGGEWYDCDNNESFCALCGQLNWTKGGQDLVFGEYSAVGLQVGAPTQCLGYNWQRFCGVEGSSTAWGCWSDFCMGAGSSTECCLKTDHTTNAYACWQNFCDGESRNIPCWQNFCDNPDLITAWRSWEGFCGGEGSSNEFCNEGGHSADWLGWRDFYGDTSLIPSGGSWEDFCGGEGRYSEFCNDSTRFVAWLGWRDFCSGTVSSTENWRKFCGSTGRTTECCGDDRDEFWNYQKTGCKYEEGCGVITDGNNNWPLPYFRTNANDDVCCSDPDDATFKSTCYPDGPYRYSGWSVRAATGITDTPNLVAKEGVWYDCDSDENTCTSSRGSGYCGLNWTKTGEYIVCGEYLPLPGMPQGPLGGGPAEPLHNDSILKECCGDDPGEIYANTSQGRQGSVERFEACCNSPNDCVDFDGDCVTHCQFSQDVDSFLIGLPDFSNYQCILGDWWPKISGNVTDVYGYAIQGAEVRVVGAYFRGGHVGTWNTDSAGEYYIYVPNGTYDVLASKRTGSNIFYGYEDTVFFSVDIQEPVRVDFVLRNRSTDCTEDCTRSDGLCHASCDGLSGCSNFIDACDLAAPGIIRTVDPLGVVEFFNCCNNATVPSRLPADVSVCGDNVVKFVRPVVLRGQFVNMVLVVFEESPDC